MTPTKPRSAVRVGTKLVLDLAAARFGGLAIDQMAQGYILAALADLGPGLPAKAAQLYAALRDEPRCELGALTMPDAEVRTLLRETAPQLWAELRSLSPAASAGSLGQVHRGLLHSGAVVAVKVQYPSVAVHVQAQLGRLLTAAGVAAKMGFRAFAHQEYLGFFAERLAEETNYRFEANSQKRHRDRLAGHVDVLIPEVFEQLSGPTVLVQEWIDHRRLGESVDLSVTARRALAQQLIDALLFQLFSCSEVHGDFSEGNVGITIEAPARIVLFDFGSVLTVAPDHGAVLRDVLGALRDGRPFDGLAAFCALGFERSALLACAECLPALWEVLLRPFCCAGEFVPASWNFREESAALLGRHRLAFRLAGPPWFLLLMRTCAGLGSCLRALDVPLAAKVGVRRSSQQAKESALAFELPVLAPPPSPPLDAARFLYVRVTEGAVERVLLEFPVGAVQHLEDLVPEDVRERLAAMGHDLAAIRNRAVASGSTPQVLFHADVAERKVQVWLA